MIKCKKENLPNIYKKSITEENFVVDFMGITSGFVLKMGSNF